MHNQKLLVDQQATCRPTKLDPSNLSKHDKINLYVRRQRITAHNKSESTRLHSNAPTVSTCDVRLTRADYFSAVQRNDQATDSS